MVSFSRGSTVHEYILCSVEQSGVILVCKYSDTRDPHFILDVASTYVYISPSVH